MKKILKAAGIALAAAVIILIAYVAYLFADYHRIEDNLNLETELPADTENALPAGETLTPGESLSLVSWNIGFGAYTDDYSFFMDGGEYSWGFSEETVRGTVEQIRDDLVSFDSDFYFLQEVDTDATRSYHLNEYDIITESFGDKYKVFAQNYDSSFLFYPFTQPHGSSRAGTATISSYPVTSSLRRSLPAVLVRITLTAAVVIVVLSAAAIHFQLNGSYHPDRAIVLGETVELRSLPGEASGSVVATIPGGSDAKILDRNGAFIRIGADGQDGWVPAGVVMPLY